MPRPRRRHDSAGLALPLCYRPSFGSSTSKNLGTNATSNHDTSRPKYIVANFASREYAGDTAGHEQVKADIWLLALAIQPVDNVYYHPLRKALPSRRSGFRYGIRPALKQLQTSYQYDVEGFAQRVLLPCRQPSALPFDQGRAPEDRERMLQVVLAAHKPNAVPIGAGLMSRPGPSLGLGVRIASRNVVVEAKCLEVRPGQVRRLIGLRHIRQRRQDIATSYGQRGRPLPPTMSRGWHRGN